MSIANHIARMADEDTAVYWAAPTRVGAAYTWPSGSEIDCIWMENEEAVRTDGGEELISAAQVYLTQAIDEEGMIYHGLLADLDSDEGEDPTKIKKAYRIVKVRTYPSLAIPNERTYKVWISKRRL